jgi:NAD(P)-dependent dehydrogenase (short-subunit alcohol dehydrogenase family)
MPGALDHQGRRRVRGTVSGERIRSTGAPVTRRRPGVQRHRTPRNEGTRLVTLDGFVAVVTGASRGIGKATALELGAHGATVVVASRTEHKRERLPGTIVDTAAQIETVGGRALAIRTDLSREEEIDALVDRTLSEFGQCDLLVNNAAFTGRALFLPIWDMTRKQFELQVAINLTAPFLLTKGFGEHMKVRGEGRVLNLVSGVSAGGALPGLGGPGCAYGTTKGALGLLTESLAKELAPHGIAITALQPGFVLTELMAEGLYSDTPPALAIPMHVPASVVAWFAAHKDPMSLAGKILNGPDVAAREGLRSRLEPA